MTATGRKTKYIYGPVHSWRTGTSLGIDPIGDVSTCSFNCVYCQLGNIQKLTSEIKEYVSSEEIIKDLNDFEKRGLFQYQDLDVITFAGSGEPTLASNLGEISKKINEIQEQRIKEGKLKKRVPISILTNATMFNDEAVVDRALKTDMISVKLDAPNDEYLRLINQAAEGISISSIISGIKKLKENYKGKLQFQMMFMPKYLKDENFIGGICKLIIETGINEIQINTPTRPKPLGREYHIASRGNHPKEDEHNPNLEDYKTAELPVITREEAFYLEDQIREKLRTKIPDLKIINVYKDRK